MEPTRKQKREKARREQERERELTRDSPIPDQNFKPRAKTWENWWWKSIRDVWRCAVLSENNINSNNIAGDTVATSHTWKIFNVPKNRLRLKRRKIYDNKPVQAYDMMPKCWTVAQRRIISDLDDPGPRRKLPSSAGFVAHKILQNIILLTTNRNINQHMTDLEPVQIFDIGFYVSCPIENLNLYKTYTWHKGTQSCWLDFPEFCIFLLTVLCHDFRWFIKLSNNSISFRKHAGEYRLYMPCPKETQLVQERNQDRAPRS